MARSVAAVTTMRPADACARTSPTSWAPPPAAAPIRRRLPPTALRLVRNGLRVALESGTIGSSPCSAPASSSRRSCSALSLVRVQRTRPVNKIPFKGLIVGGLFDLLFFTLGAMLIFSTGIILYASLFTAPETRFLLTHAGAGRPDLRHKFQAAVAFSSWAFVILGAADPGRLRPRRRRAVVLLRRCCRCSSSASCCCRGRSRR